jgi:2-polyprenyl-3-methyl-5-hydroxy-6-metoxy-1,4-benzoquinol methylase
MNDSGDDEACAPIIERLNAAWRFELPASQGRSLTTRLTYPLRKVLARLMFPQVAFNSAVVQYLNSCVLPSDEVWRFREALAARERRMEAAMAAMRAQQQELQTSIGVLQQATHKLARDTARHAGTDAPRQASGVPDRQTASAAGSSDALSYTYVGFEDQFRGTGDEIRVRIADYAKRFAGASDVLDIGCGRGEFLELMRDHRVSARGIDLNEAMVESCRAKGLDATRTDALTYLRAQDAGSLGGLFAAQVVEHLEPGYLTQLLEAAFHALRPGAPIVLETINPACWFAFFESYLRDITHARALHPDTLKFLLVASGFQQVEVQYRVPYPEHHKLQPIRSSPPLTDAAETFNANVEKLNRLLFTYLDYAAIGRRA